MSSQHDIRHSTFKKKVSEKKKLNVEPARHSTFDIQKKLNVEPARHSTFDIQIF